MAPLADFILATLPLPSLPAYLTSYVAGKTPLSTWNAVIAALVSYLAVIFSLQHVMRNQQALKLRVPLFFVPEDLSGVSVRYVMP